MTAAAHVQGFAHGKVILLGEHAVVYGHPALCGALAAGVTLTTGTPPAALAQGGALCVPAWGVRTPTAAMLLAEPPSEGADLTRAYASLLAAVQAALPSVDVGALLTVDLSASFAIPTSAGLGSSAALAVATARLIDALLRRAGAPGLRAADIAAAALASEKVFHGRPSGLDHTVAQHGGFGLFRRAQGSLTPVAAPPLKLLIGQTGRARDTRGRVTRVAQIYEQHTAQTLARFAIVETLVEAAARAVALGDVAALGLAMNHNQEILRELEVSCPEIDAMCTLARDAGALGAKLTGGGGGGCVIAVADGDAALQRVQAAWREAGFASFVSEVAA